MRYDWPKKEIGTFMLRPYMKKKIKFHETKGNVFKDLGISHPEESLAKAEAAHQIAKIIKKHRLKQSEAAAVLGIDQPKVSAIIRGRLDSFSLERLLRFLNDLGQDVYIAIKPSSSKVGHTHIGESFSSCHIAALAR